MIQKQSRSPEHWAVNVFGDILTKGKIDIVTNVWHVIVKVNASIVLTFFRYQTGRDFISGATLFCGLSLMSLCWMAEQTARTDTYISTGAAPEGESSLGFIMLWMVIFLIMGLYRRHEAIKNLRRVDGKGKPRYSSDGGLSHLWMPFRRMIEPFGWVASIGEQASKWQLNEYKFQKYVEPSFIILIGLLIRLIGYGVFGGYIFICGICCFLMITHLEQNYFEKKQALWDAEVLSNVVQRRDEPVQRSQGVVIQQAIIRSDQEFDEWKKSSQTSSRFDVSEPQYQNQPT